MKSKVCIQSCGLCYNKNRISKLRSRLVPYVLYPLTRPLSRLPFSDQLFRLNGDVVGILSFGRCFSCCHKKRKDHLSIRQVINFERYMPSPLLNRIPSWMMRMLKNTVYNHFFYYLVLLRVTVSI